MKLLPIPACQRILPPVVALGKPAHLCGAPSVAVIQWPDGQERFVCAEHREGTERKGETWHLHRRGAAARPVEIVRNPRREPPSNRKPRKPWSAEARARMSASQRARWARERGVA